MSSKCPICSSEIEDNATVCSVCGFRLQGNTEQFEPIELPEGKHNRSLSENTNKTAYLLVLRGLQKGSQLALSDREATLGRDPSCTIFLNDMTVSRLHATIVYEKKSHIIRDEGSFNGVWINNKNVVEKALQDGDIIQLGTFCFEYKSYVN